MILLEQGPILVIDPLSNVSNQLQVMLQLSLPFLLVGPRVSLARLALLHFLLHLGQLGVKLSDDIFLLLFLELVYSLSDIVYLLNDLLLELLVDVRILDACIFLETKTDAQLMLQFIDVLAVL